MAAAVTGDGAEIAGTVVALAVSYTLRSAGPDGLIEISRRVGLDRVEQSVSQPDRWVGYEEARAAVDAAADICGEVDIGYRLGEEAARVLEEQGRLSPFRNGDFTEVIEVLTTVLANANSIRQMRCLEIGDGVASMEAASVSHPDDPLLCRLVVGFLTAVPAYIGRTGLAVETQCVVDGADVCRFAVNWQPGPASQSKVPSMAVRRHDESDPGHRADAADGDDGIDVAALLGGIITNLSLPHHVLGVQATVLVGDEEFTHRRGSLDSDGATTFTAPVVGAPDVTGTVAIAFSGRGLPAIDQHLVAWCAAQIGSTVNDATQLSALRTRASLDPLTGLANRALLEQRAAEIDDGTAVVFLDLDKFKQVNDGHGHAVGDTLLARVGERLRGAVRSSDLVARYGGDEFVALIAGTVSVADAEAVASKLVATFDAPFAIAETEVRVGASWGVARAPDDGSSFDELASIADARMYGAKSGSDRG